jgi:hypothetical protein
VIRGDYADLRLTETSEYTCRLLNALVTMRTCISK